MLMLHRSGRRYFRLLKWHSCWNAAYAILNGDEEDAMAKLLAVCNYSVLGLYYFLEMPTIVSVQHASFTKIVLLIKTFEDKRNGRNELQLWRKTSA